MIADMETVTTSHPATEETVGAMVNQRGCMEMPVMIARHSKCARLMADWTPCTAHNILDSTTTSAFAIGTLRYDETRHYQYHPTDENHSYVLKIPNNF